MITKAARAKRLVAMAATLVENNAEAHAWLTHDENGIWEREARALLTPGPGNFLHLIDMTTEQLDEQFAKWIAYKTLAQIAEAAKLSAPR